MILHIKRDRDKERDRERKRQREREDTIINQCSNRKYREMRLCILRSSGKIQLLTLRFYFFFNFIMAKL